MLHITKPKFAKVIINTASELSVITGPSSLTPNFFRQTPPNALELYNIRLNAFTLNDSDVVINKIENRRYTMADIGRL